MQDKGRKIITDGYALCIARIGINEYIISTLIEVPATVFDDWQEDGGFYHNEGWVDYDYDNVKIVYPDEYYKIDIFGNKYEGNKKVDKIIKVLKANLKEKEV